MALKQSTARNIMLFMSDEADPTLGLAGLTLTVEASKDGGAFASITPSAVTDRGDGWYSIGLTTSHTDTLGDLVIRATATGAIAGETRLEVEANTNADVIAAIAALESKVDIIDTNVDDIEAKTANLPSDPADQSLLIAAISAVETKVDTVDSNVDDIKAKTDNLPSDPADASVIAGRFDSLDTAVGGIPTNPLLDDDVRLNNLDSPISDCLQTSDYVAPPDVGQIADAVWDEDITTHNTADSAGAALQAAGSGGDPWATTLPGSYTGSQAGKILSDVKAKTDNLPSDPADASVIAGRFDSVDSALGAIPTNPLLDDDARLDHLDADISSRAAPSDIPNVGAIADQVWDENITTHNGANSAGLELQNKLATSGYTTPPTAGAIADAVLDEPLSGHTTSGTLGQWLNDKFLTVSKYLGLQ